MRARGSSCIISPVCALATRMLRGNQSAPPHARSGRRRLPCRVAPREHLPIVRVQHDPARWRSIAGAPAAFSQATGIGRTNSCPGGGAARRRCSSSDGVCTRRGHGRMRVGCIAPLGTRDTQGQGGGGSLHGRRASHGRRVGQRVQSVAASHCHRHRVSYANPPCPFQEARSARIRPPRRPIRRRAHRAASGRGWCTGPRRGAITSEVEQSSLLRSLHHCHLCQKLLREARGCEEGSGGTCARCSGSKWWFLARAMAAESSTWPSGALVLPAPLLRPPRPSYGDTTRAIPSGATRAQGCGASQLHRGKRRPRERLGTAAALPPSAAVFGGRGELLVWVWRI